MSAAAGDGVLWIVGGGNVASQFADAGLLDELHVTVVPVVLGEGKPLFDRRLPGPPMQLTDVLPRAERDGRAALRGAAWSLTSAPSRWRCASSRWGASRCTGSRGGRSGSPATSRRWRWSEHVGGDGEELCQVEHLGYVVSGSAAVLMEDGTELVMKAGDFFAIPPGHDSWVVGDEPYVSLHLMGADEYAE